MNFLEVFEFVGAGRVVNIVLNGWKRKNFFPKVRVFDTNQSVAEALKSKFSHIEVVKSYEDLTGDGVVVLAIPFQVIPEVLTKLTSIVKENTLVLSFAPKVKLKELAESLKVSNIARLVPTATSYINQGFNVVAFSSDFNEELKAKLINTFSLLGTLKEVEEVKLEAFAILCAMLPTYFWFQWETLESLGVKMGLDESEIKEGLATVLKGAVELFYSKEVKREEVKDLIPVKPLKEKESTIKEYYETTLLELFKKLS